jgi:hypothetical protein
MSTTEIGDWIRAIQAVDADWREDLRNRLPASETVAVLRCGIDGHREVVGVVSEFFAITRFGKLGRGEVGKMYVPCNQCWQLWKETGQRAEEPSNWRTISAIKLRRALMADDRRQARLRSNGRGGRRGPLNLTIADVRASERRAAPS